MRGNSHVQFLMGKAAVTPLTYITKPKNQFDRNLLLRHIRVRYLIESALQHEYPIWITLF